VDPEGKPAVSTLFGKGLLIRSRTIVSPPPGGGGETLVTPSDALDVAPVDYDPDVFSDPRSFVSGGDRVAKLGLNLPTLNSGPPPPALPAPAPLTPPAAPQVNFSTTRVTVLLDSDTTDSKGVFVAFQEAQPLPGDEPERRIAQGAIISGTHFISLDLKTNPDGPAASIPVKDFYVLALIAGYQPRFGKQPPAP